jgi:integrase
VFGALGWHGSLQRRLPGHLRAPPAHREQVRPDGGDLPGGRPATSGLPGRPRDLDLAVATREDLEAFPATAANRYRALRVFYAWLEDEGEIPTDPMVKMKPPRVPEQAAPVLPEDLLRRLPDASAGQASRHTATAP